MLTLGRVLLPHLAKVWRTKSDGLGREVLGIPHKALRRQQTVSRNCRWSALVLALPRSGGGVPSSQVELLLDMATCSNLNDEQANLVAFLKRF